MTAREWPIIFSPLMVRALLDGRKTQTRRLPTSMWRRVYQAYIDDYAPEGSGIRLWVRERWTINHNDNPRYPPERIAIGYEDEVRILFKACEPEFSAGKKIADPWNHDETVRWRPSIHMPRWASRITLRVTDMLQERLQEITSADAIAEGIGPYGNSMTIDCATRNPRDDFPTLWNTLHAKPGTRWADNPEVYRIAFERIDP